MLINHQYKTESGTAAFLFIARVKLAIFTKK